MLRFLGSLVFFILATPLAALEFSPPAPDSHSFIRVRALSCTCARILRTEVTVSGSTIVATPVYEQLPPGGGCGASCSVVWLDLGRIAPGVYTVTTLLDERGPLVVRDAESGIRVSPVGGPAEGKRSVQVYGARFGDTVLFDGVPAPLEQVGAGFLLVTPPPHAPGTVDVTVGAQTLLAAYTYFDPDAAPDPFIFEPLLFPVAYDGGGEFGSDWRTENRMAAGQALVRFRRPVPAKSCLGDCDRFDWSGELAGQSQSGLLIWMVRRRLPLTVRDDLRLSARVFEVSRAERAGTSLPVAREDDFRDLITFDSVPVGGNTRATVRLYALAAGTGFVQLTMPSGAVTLRSVELKTINGVAFGALDLPAMPRPGRVKLAVNALSGKLWALVTITDNDTQEVTALWPQ